MELPEDDEEGEAVVRDQTEAIVDAVKELVRRGAGRRPGLPARRAGDPRHRRRARRDLPRDGSRSCRSTRGSPPPSSTGSSQLAPRRTPRRARHQRRRDLADRARHPVRRRHRRRADLALLRAHQGAAAARSSRSARPRPTSARAAAAASRPASRSGSTPRRTSTARPEFTDPEILRTNLASVILQMTSLGLGDIAPVPVRRAARPAQRHRRRAAARGARRAGLDGRPHGRRRLTKVGRAAGRLPIDPRLARMILEAERLGCVREVLVIAAALSLQDPRERPAEQRPGRPAARAVQGRGLATSSPGSTSGATSRSSSASCRRSAFRRMCKREYLNYLRVREWQDFESQLRQVCKEMKIEVGQPADDARRRRHPPGAAVRAALATSGCSRSGTKDAAGSAARASTSAPAARGSRSSPAAALHRKNPQFLMAGELVETSRLWARQNAAIKPEWAERLGAHLVKRTYSEPHWSQEARRRDGLRAGHAVRRTAGRRPARSATARSTPRSPASCSSGTRWSTASGTTRHRFFDDEPAAARGGRGARAPRPAPRHRGRRAHAVRLLRRPGRRRGGQRRALRPVVEAGAAAAARPADLRPRRCSPTTPPTRCATPDYPEQLAGSEGLTFPISYHFEPGAADDGLTIDVPVATLNRVEADDFSWNVPGLREELVTA